MTITPIPESTSITIHTTTTTRNTANTLDPPLTTTSEHDLIPIIHHPPSPSRQHHPPSIPPHPPVTEDTVTVDTHVHTVFSDGVLTGREVGRWARASGVDVVFLGRVVEEVERDGSGVLVLPAMEFTTCLVHLNFLGIKEVVTPCGGEVVVTGNVTSYKSKPGQCPHPSLSEVKTIIDQVHELGGIVILNHMAWSTKQEGISEGWPRQQRTLPRHPDLETLVQMGVDGVEVVNGMTLDWGLVGEVRRLGLVGVSGSDMHVPGGMYGWTVVNVKERTMEGVMEELKGRRSSVLYDARGLGLMMPEVAFGRESVVGRVVKGLVWVAGLVKVVVGWSNGMNSFQGGFCHEREWRVDGVSLAMVVLVYVPGFVALFYGVYGCVGWAWRWVVERMKKKRGWTA
ncbi:Polymerase/histidinol phosphatase-like protein [Chytridium lagenaria]|nr:Polymerase/histidinol phosphatase-like protein [Chytridium lagenaria]